MAKIKQRLQPSFSFYSKLSVHYELEKISIVCTKKCLDNNQNFFIVKFAKLCVFDLQHFNKKNFDWI